MKTERIEIRVTAEQQKRIKERAENLGMAVSEYMLFCTLNADVRVSVGVDRKINDDIEILHRQHERGLLTREQFERALKILIGE